MTKNTPKIELNGRISANKSGGDGPSLSLDACGLLGEGEDLILALSSNLVGSHGHDPELMLRGDELLLEHDVGSREPLVVDKELLDVAVVFHKMVLEHRDSRIGGEILVRVLDE
ncbi:hypothetical protein ABZP36_008116 [Zizania latifolia]